MLPLQTLYYSYHLKILHFRARLFFLMSYEHGAWDGVVVKALRC
jgi:hypothetical protein